MVCESLRTALRQLIGIGKVRVHVCPDVGRKLFDDVMTRDSRVAEDAALPGLPHVNGSQGPAHNGHPTNRDASSASSNSVPSVLEETLQVGGSSEIDVERQPDAPTLAARVRLLEDMLESHTQNMEGLLAEQSRRIDAHLRHIHIQVTLMSHSFMRDIQGMLQQVFDEVAAVRAEIAQLRNDV
ncbi:uncharacterized protein [Dermacentor albipictus]|uniref:uncharacterized protein n=1 Tax=Dermacentor albipictus TaxID=60249 RepID=UPI0038FC1289